MRDEPKLDADIFWSRMYLENLILFNMMKISSNYSYFSLVYKRNCSSKVFYLRVNSRSIEVVGFDPKNHFFYLA